MRRELEKADAPRVGKEDATRVGKRGCTESRKKRTYRVKNGGGWIYKGGVF